VPNGELRWDAHLPHVDLEPVWVNWSLLRQINN